MHKFENIKHHRENQRNQNNQRGQGNNYQTPSRKPNKTKHDNLSDPCPRWQTWVWSFVCCFLVFSMVVYSFCLDLFCCFGFFGFPYGFWCFQMYTWFLEKTRAWMRSFVEQVVHFTRVSIYKRLPCILISLCKWFPLYLRGVPLV